MTALGKYEILEQLGAGSVGTVYRARDTILDRDVALKTILTGIGEFEEHRVRFYREARACAKLQHSSIVVIHDLGEAENVAYIAMELLRGQDFRRLIEERKDFPLLVKLKAMARTCEALAYAHRQGILHRDIKPSNLFLTDDRHPKVLDFGIARLPNSRLTLEGKILGTPNYMAPEQIQGKPTDGRSDLFSAAVVFFEFLTYAHPFQAELIPRRIVEDGPDSLLSYPQKFPVLLEKIFARALAREPDRRYRTGDDLAGDLRAVVEALEQSSSPTFSRLQLPSHRDLHNPPLKPLPETDTATKAKGDSYESNMAELMRLIPEYETASVKGEPVLANRILSQIDAIGAADPRLNEMVRKYRAGISAPQMTKRWGEAYGESTTPKGGIVPPPPAPLTPSEISSPKVCGYCGASNRSAAVYCIKCGAQIPGPSPKSSAVAVPSPAAPPVQTAAPPPPIAPEPPPAVVPVPTPQRSTVVLSSPSMVGPLSTDTPVNPPVPEIAPYPPPIVDVPSKSVSAVPEGEWSRIRKQVQELPREWKLIAILSAAAAVLIATIAIVWALWPVSVRPALASAVSQTDSQIRKQPTTSSKGVPVFRGETLNIVQLPASRDQEWVLVQLVRQRKVFAPGYIGVRDLQHWNSANPDTRLSLIRMFRPAQFTTDDQILPALAELQQLIDQFSGTRVAQQASADMVPLELLLVQQKKSAGLPFELWQKWLESARKHLDDGSKVTSAQTIKGFQDQIDALTPPVPAANPTLVQSVSKQQVGSSGAQTAKKKPTSAAQIEEMISKARTLFNTNITDRDAASNLDEAERLLDEVLTLDPGNQAATDLKSKIPGRRKVIAM